MIKRFQPQRIDYVAQILNSTPLEDIVSKETFEYMSIELARHK